MISPDLLEAMTAAKKHARAEYPRESCGLIVRGAYVPCINQAADPATHEDGNDDCVCQLCSFRISSDDMIAHDPAELQMIVHSHPNGPYFPSRADAQGQLSTDVAWGIIALDEERTSDALVWGGDTPMSPLIGRTFMHYTADCYTLIKDVFALGHDVLKEQGIDWPFAPIALPEYPRADAWWTGKDDFYNDEPFKIGFKEVPREEAQPGDVFLINLRSEKMNHGGVMLENNLILHHLPNRLSRREPIGIWAKSVKRWLRYTGVTDNA